MEPTTRCWTPADAASVTGLAVEPANGSTTDVGRTAIWRVAASLVVMASAMPIPRYVESRPGSPSTRKGITASCAGAAGSLCTRQTTPATRTTATSAVTNSAVLFTLGVFAGTGGIAMAGGG